jgi:hypothetical protein
MPVRNDASPGTIPATTSLGETRRHSAPYREAVRQARQLLAAQESARRERRERRWAELAVQLLAAQHAQGVEDVSEERLFVLAYEVVRGDRTAALATPDSLALREVTRRVWLAQDPGESQVQPAGIEEAATAGDCSPSSGTGATVVVSEARQPARSSSPVVPDLLRDPVPIGSDGRPDFFLLCASLSRAQLATLPVETVAPAPGTCCDTPTPVAVECPVCEGDPYRPVQVGRMSPPKYSECPHCEGQGTITECDACGAEVES